MDDILVSYKNKPVLHFNGILTIFFCAHIINFYKIKPVADEQVFYQKFLYANRVCVCTTDFL